MTEFEVKPRENMETCTEPPAESIDNNNKPDKAAEQENQPIIADEKSSKDTSILSNVPVQTVNDSTQVNNIPSKPVFDDDESATSKPISTVNDVSETINNEPSNVNEIVENEPSNDVIVTSTSNSDSNAFIVNHENPSKQVTNESIVSEQLNVNINPSNEHANNSDKNDTIESEGVNLQECKSSRVVDSNHESQSKDQDKPTESNNLTESFPTTTTAVVEDAKTTTPMELSCNTITTNTNTSPMELTTVVSTSPMDLTETSSTLEVSTVITTSPLELSTVTTTSPIELSTTTTPNVLTMDAPVVSTTSMDLSTTLSPIKSTVASPVVSAIRTLPPQTTPNSSQTKPVSQQSLSTVVVGSSSQRGISTATNTTTTFLPQHVVTTLSPPLRPQFTTRTTFVPQTTASSINSPLIIPQQHSTQSTAVQTQQQHSIRRTSTPQHHNNTTTITSANGEVAQLMNIPSEFLSSGGPILLSRNGQVISTSGVGNAMMTNTGTQHIIVQDEANNVISIPEDSFPHGLNGFAGSTIKLENGSYLRIPGSTAGGNAGKFLISPSGQIITSANGNGLTLTASSNDANVISIPEPPQMTSQLPTAPHPIKIEPTNGMTARPPNTELLLKTAKSMLQLPDEEPPMAIESPPEYKHGVFSGSILEVDESGTILSTTTAQEGEEYAITDNVQEMEVEENATYILESVDGGEQLYAENPNIMWIEETVEVEQEANGGGQENMVIILNPNGTINEELMMANGFNMETIKALSEAMGGLGGGEGNEVVTESTLPPPPPPTSSAHEQHLGVETSLSSTVSSIHSGITSITSLQHPIPKKLLAGVEPIMNTTSLPPGVLASVGKIEPGLHQSIHNVHQSMHSVHQPPHSVHQPAHSVHQHLQQQSEQRFVRFTDAKEECMLLDDVKDPLLTQQGLSQQLHGKIVSINGQHHLITTSNKPMPNLRRITDSQNLVTPLGTLDLRVGKREDSFGHHFLSTANLMPDSSVLKVLGQSDLMKGKRGSGDGHQGPPKVKRQRIKDENGNGTYLNRKTTSLGALGQALHGIPRDSRENAVQICPICKFQATTKNPYRHLQDHLARVHFKERIAAELPTKKPYTCPFQGCDGKQYPDWQAVMRHYIGKKHGILDKYVRETIAETGIKLPEQYVINNMGLAM